MDVTKEKINDVLSVKIIGSVDTNTAQELKESIDGELAGVKELRFDMSELDYTSSAGLRVFLSAFKVVNKNGGKVVLCSMNEDVKEIFELTGFLRLMEVE